MRGSGGDDRHPQPRVIHLVRGDPSDEELAVLTAVLTVLVGARSAPARPPEPAVPRPAWADPARRLRATLHPGPGAWRTSTLPA